MRPNWHKQLNRNDRYRATDIEGKDRHRETNIERKDRYRETHIGRKDRYRETHIGRKDRHAGRQILREKTDRLQGDRYWEKGQIRSVTERFRRESSCQVNSLTGLFQLYVWPDKNKDMTSYNKHVSLWNRVSLQISWLVSIQWIDNYQSQSEREYLLNS